MFIMKIHKINAPVFIRSVLRHTEIKSELINIIKSGLVFSYKDSNISVYNTDYHVHSTFFNIIGPKYWDVLFPEVQDHMRDVSLALDLTEWSISKYWYQEYRQGDYQPWHTHPRTGFTNVYYLSLPEGSKKTTLNIFGTETEFEVKEGDIMTIPGYVKHCSKIHTGDDPKIIIAFNADIN